MLGEALQEYRQHGDSGVRCVQVCEEILVKIRALGLEPSNT